MDSPKFSEFNISSTPYKAVNGHDIAAYVLIPKNAPAGKLPIFVAIHGGFLITGAALYSEWFPQWILDYAAATPAIIIAPNYRLLPEASGLEILSDLSDFWTWLRSAALRAHLAAQAIPDIQPDIDRIVCAGASAGGYLAIQSAFSQPYGSIRAVIASYPMIDVTADFYTKAFTKPMFGAPMLPASIVDAHLTCMEPGAVVTEANPPDRLQLAMATVQQGRWVEFLGEDDSLYPMKTIEHAEKMPLLFLYHGKDDSAVPVEGSEKFAALARQKFSSDTVHLYTGPGDHGFDIDVPLETPWLKEGLEKITPVWLTGSG